MYVACALLRIACRGILCTALVATDGVHHIRQGLQRFTLFEVPYEAPSYLAAPVHVAWLTFKPRRSEDI